LPSIIVPLSPSGEGMRSRRIDGDAHMRQWFPIFLQD